MKKTPTLSTDKAKYLENLQKSRERYMVQFRETQTELQNSKKPETPTFKPKINESSRKMVHQEGDFVSRLAGQHQASVSRKAKIARGVHDRLDVENVFHPKINERPKSCAQQRS